mmetsp:Transcript_49797/g.115607  ORF Transcript_49797/g.115607 Transcript_49797/m.115607 type:complete len:203 (-) Transcript_49797:8-616(-)
MHVAQHEPLTRLQAPAIRVPGQARRALLAFGEQPLHLPKWLYRHRVVREQHKLVLRVTSVRLLYGVLQECQRGIYEILAVLGGHRLNDLEQACARRLEASGGIRAVHKGLKLQARLLPREELGPDVFLLEVVLDEEKVEDFGRPSLHHVGCLPAFRIGRIPAFHSTQRRAPTQSRGQLAAARPEASKLQQHGDVGLRFGQRF